MYVYFVYENCTYMSVRYNVNKKRKNAQYAVGSRKETCVPSAHGDDALDLPAPDEIEHDRISSSQPL